MECIAGCKHTIVVAMEPAMSNVCFGFDPSAWKALSPARQGAQLRLLAQREQQARSRALGIAILGAFEFQRAGVQRLLWRADRVIRSVWTRFRRRRQRRRDLL